MLSSKFVFSLLFSLANYELAKCAKDEDVVVTGGTVPPGHSRPYSSGIVMPNCPSSYPYPFANWLKCCKPLWKENDLTLAADCDGNAITPVSSQECCLGQMSVDCPNQEFGCKKAEILSTCTANPTISYSDPPYNSKYIAANSLSFVDCETSSSHFFLSPNYQTDVKYVVDLGCEMNINQFVLRNTRNGGANDRGTKDFTVETSLDGATWELVLSETLPSAQGINICEMPLHTYDAKSYARFVRYTVVSHYGAGGGFNYVTWNFST